MANVHMQTAARNLQQAVSDIQLLQQQLRAETEQKKREMQQQISDLKSEESRLRSENINSDDSSQSVVRSTRINAIEALIKSIEREIYTTEDNTRKKVAELDGQASQVSSMANRLQMMA